MCTSCAVAHIIIDQNPNKKIELDDNWFHIVGLKYNSEMAPLGFQEVENSGYSALELLSIERAFESAYKDTEEEESSINPENIMIGLENVIQTLCTIDNIEDYQTEIRKFKEGFYYEENISIA